MELTGTNRPCGLTTKYFTDYSVITQRRASIATSDAQCKDPIAGMVRKPRLKPLRSVVEYRLFPERVRAYKFPVAIAKV